VSAPLRQSDFKVQGPFRVPGVESICVLLQSNSSAAVFATRCCLWNANIASLSRLPPVAVITCNCAPILPFNSRL
jgi:hypothetical protein